MPNMPSDDFIRTRPWKTEVFPAVQAALPKNATPQERGAAIKRAAAIRRGERTNPADFDLKTIMLVGIAAFLGWGLLKGQMGQ